MELDDARRMIGGLVTYEAQGGRITEWGLILRCSDTNVFVRFAGKPQPMACRPDTLTLQAPPVAYDDSPRYTPPPLDRDGLAHLLSEHLDDEAPLHVRRYLPAADAILQAMGPRWLPDPAGGCVCTDHSQDVGGYVEHLLEYDPACPEHSTHLYDPRTGDWLAATESTAWGYRLPDGTEEWAQDHSDGTWTTQYHRDGIMLQTDTADSMVDLLRQLEGHDAVLIQRRVVTADGSVEP